MQGVDCEHQLVDKEKSRPELCNVLKFGIERAGPTADYHNFVSEVGGVNG